MKSFFKFLAFIAAVVALLRLAELGIDFLYRRYGKQYLAEEEFSE